MIANIENLTWELQKTVLEDDVKKNLPKKHDFGEAT